MADTSNKGANEDEPLTLKSSNPSFRLIIDQPSKIAQSTRTTLSPICDVGAPCHAHQRLHAHEERNGGNADIADSAREANDSDGDDEQDIHVAGQSLTSLYYGSSGQARRKKAPSGRLKRPLSAYNIYSKARRQKLLSDGKQVSFADLAKIIGKGWKEIDGVEREKYEQMANEETARYRAALDAYNAKMRQQNHNAREETIGSRRRQNDTQSIAGLPFRNTQDPQIRSHFSPPFALPCQTFDMKSIFSTTEYQHDIQQQNPAGSFLKQTSYQRHPEMVLWPHASGVMFSGSVTASSATHVLPIPHGAHVMLPDHTGTQRLHVVQYKYCRMTKRTAQEYIGLLQQTVSKPVKAIPSHSYGSWFDTSRNTWHSVDSFDSDGYSYR